MTDHMGGMQLDDTDRRILALLRENARASNVELARRAQISRTTLQARIERLERARVIAGYTIRGGGEHERQAIRAHVMITAAPKLAPALQAALQKIPEVRTLHSVSGTFDMVAVVVAETVDEMDRLIDRIGALEGVERTTTAIILSTRIDR
jgi:DNA-binding Lrp family transcriptional regulator